MNVQAIIVLALAGWLAAGDLNASPMRFEPGGNDTRCRECGFIQATGEITKDTPAEFRRFLDRYEFHSHRVRIDSPGGDLAAALELGEIFREKRFATEVGSDVVVPDGHPAFGKRASERRPGVCASACAYAVLGGVERRIDAGSKFGVHRFYRESALLQPTSKLFTGQDLDVVQRTTAALVLYVVRMGVDARLVSIAAASGPTEMSWVNAELASELRIIYEPEKWKPWRIETYRNGVIAISEKNNAEARMVASCTKRFGPQVVLTDLQRRMDISSWFEQARTCPFDGYHPVFGAKVTPSRVQVIRRAEGGAAIRFRFPSNRLTFDSPAILSRESGAYPTACSTVHYEGSNENFRAAVEIAFRNCFDD